MNRAATYPATRRAGRFLTAGLLAALLSGAASAAVALPPLSENKFINGSLLSAGIGDEIRKNCPTISARIFRALLKARRLENYALSLGYSREEVKAFTNSKPDKARLERLRDAYLVAHGVTKGDSDSYCRLGYEEIEKNSLTGWLLRAD